MPIRDARLRRRFPDAIAVTAEPVRRWLVFAALGMAILLSSMASPVHAAKITERSKQKQVAEAERAALRHKLSNLKRDINQTETAKSHAADALARSEAAISDANRSLRELTEEQIQTASKLAQLSKEQTELAGSVDLQQKKLAKLLREHYVAGNEERIKLLLSGDNPNRINRDLQYMGYVSQAQAKLLQELQANLQTIAKNKGDTENAKSELDEIAQEERAQKAILEKEKGKRATLVSQLSSKLTTQRKAAGNIQRDEQRLAGLVDKLAVLIEQQRKADAAEAERKRQQAARARAQRQKQNTMDAKSQAKGTSAPVRRGSERNKERIDQDESAEKSVARNELTPDGSVQDGAIANSFSALRGRLRLPVKGELLAKFGSKREDGPNWKGLFIRAAEGVEIKAVAQGRVIFADWLRGFGNLIIVDHGSQYITIYGNNQSVLKRAGDAVRMGDVIASAGNSGGNEQTGLYFEMRHQGRAFDPLGWVTIR
jgi:septal ring factor EnvC (AmiA/AmiB activator)